MRYAFIGLGRLGRVLASNLARAGFAVSVYDRDVDAGAPVLELGARWASSPKDAAGNSDAVITCLPSPTQSAEVLNGADGALTALASGGSWIEMSTSDPQEIQRIAKIASGKGIHTLEAPVTGGIHRAAVGEMTAFVGGERSVYESHLPAPNGMCGRIWEPDRWVAAGSSSRVVGDNLPHWHGISVAAAFRLCWASERRLLLEVGGVRHDLDFNDIGHRTQPRAAGHCSCLGLPGHLLRSRRSGGSLSSAIYAVDIGELPASMWWLPRP